MTPMEMKASFLLQAFQDYCEAICSMQESCQGGYESESEYEYKDSEVPESKMMSGVYGEDAYGEPGEMLEESSDLPGRKFFDIDEIDTESPMFQIGFSLGIPKRLAVRVPQNAMYGDEE